MAFLAVGMQIVAMGLAAGIIAVVEPAKFQIRCDEVKACVAAFLLWPPARQGAPLSLFIGQGNAEATDMC